MNTFGKNFRLNIFGESHGSYVGVIIDGLGSGLKIDETYIKNKLSKRAPANAGKYETKRKEDDEYKIISGVSKPLNNKKSKSIYLNGNPLCVLFQNKSAKKSEGKIRPSHADIATLLKHKEFATLGGGGHSSGRLTALLVFAGAVAELYLKEHHKKISISTEICEVNGCTNKKMFEKIFSEAKKNNDSVGGIIKLNAKNVPVGLGEPFFNSFESVLSSLLYSIPSVKAVSFGLGFNITRDLGSKMNDEMRANKNQKNVEFLTNNNGGIMGGITTGEDVVVNVGIKPVPSIKKEQKTVDFSFKKNELVFKNKSIKLNNESDITILNRVRPVLESVMSIAILELFLEK